MKRLPPIANKGEAKPSRHRYWNVGTMLCIALMLSGVLCTYGYRGGIMEGATHREFITIGWLYFLTCLLVLLYVSRVTTRLDANCAWTIAFYRRAVLQFFYGCVVPAFFIFSVFIGASMVLPLQLRESTFLYIDIYLLLLLLLLVNGCYVVAFYVNYVQVLVDGLRSEQTLLEEREARKNTAYAKISVEQNRVIQDLKQQLVLLQTKLDTYKDAAKLKTSEHTSSEKDKVYLLKLGATTRRIMHRDMALFFMRDGAPWVGMKNGEQFLASEKTLSEVHKVVGDDFFLVKRSFLINDDAIERCVRLKDKRLVLYLCDKQKTQVLGPVELDEKLEKRILKVVDIVAERMN